MRQSPLLRRTSRSVQLAPHRQRRGRSASVDGQLLVWRRYAQLQILSITANLPHLKHCAISPGSGSPRLLSSLCQRAHMSLPIRPAPARCRAGNRIVGIPTLVSAFSFRCSCSISAAVGLPFFFFFCVRLLHVCLAYVKNKVYDNVF
jgi:hypothetical protein